MESPFLIGEWRIEPQLNRVVGPAGTKTLEPRTMKVLVQLVKSKPKVITRERLLNVVWEGSVVTEHSLTIAISDLRKLFGDDPQSPGFIETIRGVGYRFIAPVNLEDNALPPTPSLMVPYLGDGLAAPSIEQVNKPAIISKPVVWGIAAFLVLSVLAAGMLWKAEDDGFIIHRIKPLTTMSGVEISPAFSPDSRRVAFVAFPDSGDVSEIFVQQLGAEAPVKFTNETGAELMPTWSPDGQYIVYLRYGPNGCALQKKPSFGGPALKLRDIDCRLGGITWAPDGHSLIISAPDKKGVSRRLYVLDLQTLQLTPITNPPISYNGDFSPRFSPDGSTIAFLRTIDGSTKDIHLLKWKGEATATEKTTAKKTTNEVTPKRLTHDGVNITGFDWTSDGEAIVFASGRNENKGLWRIQLGGQSQPRLIRAVSVDDPGGVILARSGSQLVYTDWTFEVNTWRMPVNAAQEEDAHPAIASTRSDFHPAISTQQQVAFISTRTGTSEVWTSDLAGQNPVKLTSWNSQATQHPSWSPDGKRIAFEARSNGQSDIYIIEAEGGRPQRVTEHESQESRPSWSADGQFLYFGSDRSGSWQLWKVSLKNGAMEQVTHDGGIAGWEDRDGVALYYLRPDTTGIWKKTLKTGTEEHFLEADPSFLTLSENSLFYIQQPAGSLSLKVMRFDFENGKRIEVRDIPVKPIHFFARWGFAVSPDAQWIFFSQVDKSESDLMLTEGVL